KVEKFFGNDANAKVTATVEKNIKIVEITLTRGGLIFRAQERSQDLEDALDACVDSLIRQIRKNKTKLEKKLHEASFDDILTSAEDEETNFEIIRIKSIFLRPQSIDEAVLQMNMLGHQFYMFRNAATDLVSVVYKRADGGYGVIEPND
ncbi:MAG: HPF/RaiA family ribosome-associated protein, partial [Oscillospiraceae bacterium]